jgi:hypothetical protein
MTSAVLDMAFKQAVFTVSAYFGMAGVVGFLIYAYRTQLLSTIHKVAWFMRGTSRLIGWLVMRPFSKTLADRMMLQKNPSSAATDNGQGN